MKKLTLSQANLEFHKRLDTDNFRVIIHKDSIDFSNKLVYLVEIQAISKSNLKMWQATIENNVVRPIEVNSSNGVKTIPRHPLNLNEWELEDYIEIVQK